MHELHLVEGFPEQALAAIAAAARRCGGFDEASFRQSLEGRRKILSCLAWAGDAIVGYKIGFEERPRYFESWVGGVLPEHRRSGLASVLMEAQHRWCREQGFLWVTTITEGSNQPMLIVNLRAGFEVCGSFLDRRKILKVILQKPLGEGRPEGPPERPASSR